MNYDSFPKFAGRPVNPDIVHALNEIDSQVRLLMKSVCSQGAGGAKASNGTHTTGHALDFKTLKLSGDQIRKIVNELNRVGFAAVLRLKGDDLGPMLNKTEHVHAAYQGHSNYAAVHPLIQPGHRNWIESQLVKRGH